MINYLSIFKCFERGCVPYVGIQEAPNSSTIKYVRMLADHVVRLEISGGVSHIIILRFEWFINISDR